MNVNVFGFNLFDFKRFDFDFKVTFIEYLGLDLHINKNVIMLNLDKYRLHLKFISSLYLSS